MPHDRPSAKPPPASQALDGGVSSSRRTLLKTLGAGTLGASLSLPGWLSAQSASGPTVSAPTASAASSVRPFELRDVRLLPGPFRDAQQRDSDYMLSLDPDRLLHNFRVNAGLAPKAPVYGGWESQQPWVDIRAHGHTLGHWLTAGSEMFAATGDVRMRQRVDYIVDELRACQDATGSGLITAFPDADEPLLRAVSGREFPGVPWYTLHKILAGLRDAYALTGNRVALDVLVGLTDYTLALTAPMSDTALQRMLDREHGGMNEVLADVYALTGDERYLELAVRFCHEAILGPLSRAQDPLDGLHANTQVPKIVGFMRLHGLTGDTKYLDAARFFWDRVVDDRSYVTGGHGDVEHFFPPSEFAAHLDSAKTNETCGSYNMLRLTRKLFAQAPSSRYADFYERALYNTILASQDPDSGWNTYFQATKPGYLKLYHTPIDSFWCCTGSGMENHSKYGDSIYFHDEDGLYVNLFIASELRWTDKGLTVRQSTRFPDADSTRIDIGALAPVRAVIRLRVPAWSDNATLAINGERVDRRAGSDGFVAIDREWRSGDRIELSLPMHLGGTELPGVPDRVAVTYGPIVLAGRLGTEGLYPGADIVRNERTSGQILDVPIDVPELSVRSDDLPQHIERVDTGDSLQFETAGIGRPRDVTLIPYHRLHHERYNLYWQLRSA